MACRLDMASSAHAAWTTARLRAKLDAWRALEASAITADARASTSSLSGGS
jgi:hypothetical protein